MRVLSRSFVGDVRLGEWCGAVPWVSDMKRVAGACARALRDTTTQRWDGLRPLPGPPVPVSDRQRGAVGPPEMPRIAHLAEVRDELLGAGHAPRIWAKHDLTRDEQSSLRERPRPYLELCCALVRELNLGTIVEVGAVREMLTHPLTAPGQDCCNDGHSTYWWAQTGRRVLSCDISASSRRAVRALGRDHPNVDFRQAGGIEFLRRIVRRRIPIDLLFLDAWDVGEPDFDTHHAEAYLAARPMLAPTCVVAVDDTDFWDLGKARLVVPLLEADGFDVLVVGRQTIACRLQ